jgi:peptide/nickel transport system substrate-binding protein
VTTRKLAATVATLAAVAMLATACSSGGGTTPTTGATGGGNSAAAGGQTLTICMPNGPQTNNSNPFLNTASGNSLGYRWAIYEPLAQVNDTRPANKPEPWLAKSWEWNADFTQLTITARDGVKWSDGQAFTADDIAFSLQLRKDHKELNTEGLPYGDITVSGSTVTVGFTSGQFINQIKILQLFVVPKHIWSAIADPVKDPNQKPVGTGPYTLTSWTDQAVILDQNAGYWGGKLAVPQLRYTSYSGNDTETTALATGECQWGWTFIADYQNVYVAKDSAHNKVFMPAGLGIDQLMLNVTKPPFNDVAVRKALNMVVDRKQASEVAESGLFPELTNITGIPTPAGDSFIADQYKNQTYKVDVAGAKKVLTDAGYTYDGDKLMGKDGKQVSFKLWVPAGWNDYVTSQQLIAQSAQSIGMNATTDTPTADAWFAANNTGDFDAALHWTNTGMTPFEMYSNMFDPAYFLPVGQQANWNLGRYQDTAAAAAFKAYTDAKDDAGRKTALDTIQKIFVDQVPAIAVDARPAAAEYSTKYYVGWPDDANAYGNPQPTVANATWILTKLKPAA